MTQHGRAHQLVPRRHHRQHQEEEHQIEDAVATLVSVVFVSAPKTFTGDAVWITPDAPPMVTLGSPAVRTSAIPDDEKTSAEPKASSAKASSTAKESESASEKTPAASSPKSVASTLVVATSSPLPSKSIAAVTGIASSTTSAAAAASSGMSGGAKAGLVLGILLAIGALLGAVLFVYHRKKKQVQQQKLDDEKTAMENARRTPSPAPVYVEPAPSIRTERSMSTAPRLSLRPVTQFSPTFSENRKSGGNTLSAAAAAGNAFHPNNRGNSPDSPTSPWERPGAASAGQQNPFNDPSPRSNSPPQNPFDNSAAIETPQPTAPGTPQSATHPSAPNGHLNNFANPAPAIAAAEAAPVIAAAAVPMAHKNVSAAPSIKSDIVPPSPAWTDDIPASPGPAPTGPPPVAVAGGPTNGPVPAPNNVHRIQLDFKPSMKDELELRAGSLVRMLHEYDDGWALCVRMDRSQQGVVPRTCLSKHPVKPRQGPPRQGPPPRARGPPVSSPMAPGGVPHPRPLTPSSGRSSPHPPSLSPANGRMSPGPRSMSPGPRSMSPGPNQGTPTGRSRSNSNAPYGGPGQRMPSPQSSRPRSNSASQVMARRASPPGPSPMNPNAPMPSRKPVPGMAL